MQRQHINQLLGMPHRPVPLPRLQPSSNPVQLTDVEDVRPEHLLTGSHSTNLVAPSDSFEAEKCLCTGDFCEIGRARQQHEHQPPDAELHRIPHQHLVRPRQRQRDLPHVLDRHHSCAISTERASTNDGPYQVRCRPLTSTDGIEKASGPSSAENAYGSSGSTATSHDTEEGENRG